MPESDNIKIIKMTTAEAKAAAETESLTLGNEAWTEQGITETLNRNGHYFAIYKNGKPAGHGGFTAVLDEGDITNIAVRPEFCRQGLASIILYTMINEAKTLELSFLTLEVRKSNQPAISLYKKFRFAVTGERKNFYQNPTENAIIVTLDL